MTKVVKGTSLLLLTSLIVKVLSAIYRVPFQNIVGNEGFYIYQQVYPIYALGMTIALSGIPIYLSKFDLNDANYQKKMQELFTLIWLICLFLFLLFFGGASFIANLMGDIALFPIIRVASFIFLLAPYLALYRGVFQGSLDLKPTAISQLVEQMVRVILILLTSFILVARGVSLYKIGLIAMLASIIGSIGAQLILTFYGKKLKYKLFVLKKPSKITIDDFYSEGILLVLFISFMLIFQLADSFLVSNGLQNSGLTLSQSRDLKGIYDRGQPMIQVGLVFTMVFIQSLTPLISKAYQEKKEKDFLEYKNLLFKLLLLIAFPVTIGLVTLMPEVNYMLFADYKGTFALRIFAIAIFALSSLQCFQTIEQSRNQANILWPVLGIGIILKIVTTYFFVLKYQIAGASLGTLCGLIGANLCYLFIRKEKIHLSRQFVRQFLIILLIYILSLVCYQFLAIRLITSRVEAFVFTLIGVLLNGFLLLLLIVKRNLLTKEELLIVPFGSKLNKILRKKENEN